VCGIAGVVDYGGAPVSPVLMRRMAQALAHRGPDGEGVFTDRSAGFAHRRLAILDPSPAGNQPFLCPEGRYVLVYNGEVYNFQQLRAELQAQGHAFHTRTDTEVVLAAWRQWGPRCVERLNGMFAFAVWDRRARTLFLARDRYGIKPLYWAVVGQALLFASEAKALLEHPGLERRVDHEGLLEYFTFQNFFTDRTLLEGVRMFPAGCRAVVPWEGGVPAALPVERYWDFDFREPEGPVDERGCEEELTRLFRQAVQRQLVSDVEIGAYLSGGIDSGGVAAVAAAELPLIKTFTCGFDLHSASGLELGFDERKTAEHLSYLFKTEHYEVVLKAGDMERVLPSVLRHMEEPRVGQCYPNYCVARLAGKFVKVVLSGTGGDELFGGYPWRYYRAVVNDDFENYVDKYYMFWKRLIPNSALRTLFRPVAGRLGHVWTRDIFRDVFRTRPERLDRPEDYVNHSLYFEAKTFLHGLLVVEDKLSMAHGLEMRVPFLDNDLVDFAMRLPVRMKLGNLGEVAKINENEPGKLHKYYQRTRDGKLLLRRIMAAHMPAEIAGGVKQGFCGPDASWFKGESINYVRREILDSRALLYEYMDRPTVHALVEDHLCGRENRRLFIWSLLCFEWWLRTFLH
jgi:asparagine synthase (glutamine-hydrolysing)